MSRRSAWLALLLAARVLCPARAHAAPGDATRLEYARSERAARCPDRDALKAAVTKRLGYDPFFPVARQTVTVEITNTAHTLRAQMRLVDENGMIIGSRELEDRIDQCKELVATVALAISIALDPSAAMAEESAPAQSEPNTQTDVSPASDPKTGDAPVPRSENVQPAGAISGARERSSSNHAAPTGSLGAVTARAALFAARGNAPNFAFGWRLGAAWSLAWFQVLAEFSDQFPATRDARDGGSVKGSLYDASIAPCVLRAPLAACALLSVGSSQSEGLQVAAPVRQSSTYVAAGVRAEYEPLLVGAMHLLLDADALKSLTPITMTLHGQPVWKTPFASFALGLGIAMHFR